MFSIFVSDGFNGLYAFFVVIFVNAFGVIVGDFLYFNGCEFIFVITKCCNNLLILDSDTKKLARKLKIDLKKKIKRS